ncbi:MAG: nucleotidyltransferase family protein, partial [Cyclobacteriaceae bacterium]|nr:nucleotidyltransferase family protein [Cyclobacteriaceae bacterium]
MPEAPIAAVVLAAGLSTRMGTQKLLVETDNIPVVRHTVGHLVSSDVDTIVVVTGKDQEEVRDALAPFGSRITFVHNPHFASGMTSSIQAGVRSVATQDSAIMICLGDMPHIPSSGYNDLIRLYHHATLSDPSAIVYPLVAGKKGNPVIFSPAHRAAILAHVDPEGCRDLIRQQ